MTTNEAGVLPLPGLPGLPGARVPMRVREATAGDLGFIDSLQRGQTHAVGWMPWKQLEGHVEKGNVLVAERSPESGVRGPESTRDSGLPGGGTRDGSPLGYLIACDRYFKREDVGIIYQMNIAPEARRSLVAANLLKAQFERSAYGVRLYCCWCAQDLEANKFWEAMGFVPLAFRTGSRGGKRSRKPGNQEGEARIHIFWEKPIRAEDAAAAARGEFRGWWYPSQTGGGALREDRLVLPIPPGRGWWEAMPAILPGAGAGEDVGCAMLPPEDGRCEGEKESHAKGAKKEAKPGLKRLAVSTLRGGLAFGGMAAEASPAAQAPEEPKPKTKRARKVAKKNDPRLVKAARELRDRYLEKVNASAPGSAGLLEGAAGGGKYDVSRRLGEGEALSVAFTALPRLDAA